MGRRLRRSGISLRTRLLVLVAATVTGLASLLLVALMVLANREIEGTMWRDVRTTGGVLSRLLDERRSALTLACELMASQPTVLGYVFNPQGANEAKQRNEKEAKAAREHWPTMSDIAKSVQMTAQADAVVITDASGTAIGEAGVAARPSGAAVRAQQSRDAAGVKAALTGITWSSVVERQGRLMLAVAVPVKDPVTGYVRGVVVAYDSIGTPLAVDLRSVLNGGEVAFVSRGHVVGASLRLAGIALPSAVFSSQPTVVRLPAPQDARYFALYARLPGTSPADRVGFVTLRSHAEATRPAQRLQIVCAAFAAAALGFGLLAGALVARSVTRPLEAVVRAARVVRAGQWPERFTLRRGTGDEVTLLQEVFNEMTDALRASQERLLSLIDTDVLTGLDNHRRFQERIQQETERCAASGEPLGLVLLDIDHFKDFNLRKGHAAGDAALKSVADALTQSLPPLAVAARYGGEVFALLLPRHHLCEAAKVAEAVRHAASRAVPGLTLSAGCAALGPRTQNAAALVLAAELTRSQAKHLGRNRVCRFDSLPGAETAEDPQHLQRFLSDGSLATIQALAAAVDAKDPYTQGHSARVAALASRLAARIGLSADAVERVHVAGTLHDVGKIGVPDRVLQKAGRLTGEERALIETHPVLGEVIVRKVPELAATLPAVRHHHERWDGRGYPDGLMGEAIPLEARLLAVADTFDAMTSDRPYREGLPAEVALAEIARSAGTQFDPALADAFVSLLRESGEDSAAPNPLALAA